MVPDLPVLERSFLRDVGAALEPVRRKQRDLHAFLASQLERLELQAAEIERREQQTAEDRAAIAKDRAALDEKWAHFDELVETARAHAVEVQQEKQRLTALLQEQGPTEHQAELLRLHETIDQAHRQRSALEDELAAARRKLAELADAAIELNEARAEVEHLRQGRAGLDAATAAEWQSRVDALAAERDRLAYELQLSKERAADYLRERDEERRRCAEERTEWFAELRSLRQSLVSNKS
jgi:hypothetical protein